VADPLGGPVRFQYDPNSNLKKVIDPRGGEITYDYDNMDQLVTRTDQLGRQETFGYDIGGNSNSFRDRKNQLTTWSPYDDLNRPTTVTFQGGATLTYGYDAANRLTSLNYSGLAGGTPTQNLTYTYAPPATARSWVAPGPAPSCRRPSPPRATTPPIASSRSAAKRCTTISTGTSKP
jgi:YD repeat-containing protein